MKYTSFTIFSLCLIAVFSSCGNASYERNADGLIYRIYHSGKGQFVKPGSYLKIHQEASMEDTLFFSSFGKVPAYGFFDSLITPSHDFLDILHKMAVGDSAIVIRSVDTLASRGLLQYNQRFKKGSTIKVIVKVLGMLDTQEAMEQDRQLESENYKKTELVELGKYVNAQKLNNLIKTPEGVFLDIEKEGSGQKVDSGMNVKIKYTGKLIDGKIFDSNVDTSFGHTDPFSFTAGGRQVIEGWDIGVLKLKKGAKAKIFIPSMLGYGIQGSPPKIPPYSNLVFDIEVLDVSLPDSLSNK